MPDLTVVTLIHTAIRRDLEALAGQPPELAARPAVGRYLADLTQQIHNHHEAEDEGFWPLLRAAAGEQSEPVIHRMEAQHAEVLAALATVEAAPGTDRPAAAAHLAEVMNRHLDDEEANAFALVQATMSEEQVATFGQQQIAAMSDEERAYFLAWIDWDAPEPLDANLRRLLPPPLVDLIDQQFTPPFAEARAAALSA